MNEDHRQISPSPKGTLRRRAAYSLAATAAAGAAANAQAAINYSGLQNIAIGSGFSQNINLDLDAFQDVNFQNFNFAGGPYQGAGVVFGPGKMVGFTSGNAYVSALNAGFMIDAASTTIAGGSMAYGAVNPNAQFNNVTDKYVGFSFPTGANLYYAWARVDVNNAAKTFVIKDWAYETQSGVGIPAGAVPEPGTLGMLAAGGLGLAALRKKRQAA